MYLKEIRTHGFKSFADRITLEFKPGITGIVGPNGSGKSNVVDAVRWVLGEQSVKQLRGEGNMTDVIFSGSKSRKPQNIASVTLIFDNTDSYLPLDFNEVSIKRRVYKDGTNEYFINNEPCRLKDITNLLMDTGIAKESFNIISQGNIDEILRSKPVDRRAIFEEAAGVAKYKNRKLQAIRKLERTHDNMKRVEDIIGELEIQVTPLKEQKERALDYLEYKDELENIEIALIANDINTINYDYQENKKKIDILNNELLNLTTTNTSGEAKVEEYKSKISVLELKIKEKQDLLLTLTTKVEKLNSDKKIITERKNLTIDDSRFHNEILRIKEEQLKTNNDIKLLESELKTLKKALDTKEQELSKENDSLLKTKLTKSELGNKLADTLLLESKLKVKIDQLKDNIENNASVPTPVKKVLDNPVLRGVHNTIGSLLEANEMYANAIATTLGFSSTYVVTDNEESAKSAIRYLKENNLGRATFYPISVIKPRYIDEVTLNTLRNSKGFIDIASNLVKCKDEYKNIILNQLGNVIIASNIDDAVNIARLINHKYKIITIDGEVINVGGSLTGGTQKSARNTITDKYELENNLKELDKITKNIKELENKINETDYNLKALDDVIYLLNKDRLEITDTMSLKQNNLNNLEELKLEYDNDIKGYTNALDNNLSKDEEKILNEYYESVNARDLLVNEINNLREDKSKLTDELDEFEANLKKENSVYNAKSKELKTLEIEVNRADVKLDNLLTTLSENYSLTFESAVGKYKLEIDVDLARTKVNTLRNKIRDLGPVNIAAPEEYDRISTRYEFLIKQREDLTKAEDTLLEIISEMDKVMEVEFEKTFKTINENFSKVFKNLFKGGNAELKLTEPDNMLETGIEIIASPPGKKLSTISLLSGGEKTFTAISLLFAILISRPVPFCILDEVEAALDDVNVDSFGEYLKNLKSATQFIMITHKKKTMEYADTLYGITMQESGVSKIVSVELVDLK